MDYTFISRDALAEDLESLFNSKVLSFDVESTGVHSFKDVPLGFSVTNEASSAYYTDINNHYFRSLIADPSRVYIAHNSKFDRTMVKKLGINIDNNCDTMIAAHLCEEAHLDLDSLITSKTGRYLVKFSELKRPLIDMSLTELAEYAGPHARAAWILWHGYKDEDYSWRGYQYELRRNILWDVFWKLEMPLIPVLSDMEYSGVAVDASYLTDLGLYLDGKIDLLKEVLDHWVGRSDVNFNSPDQVAELFFKKLGIKPSWKKTGRGRSTVEGKYLETIKKTHPVIPFYLMYKQYQKLKGTYVDGLLRQMVNGRVYGNLNQTGTRTSRLSSSDPNLQNIPMRTEEGKKIRQAFIAPPGKMLVKADADQLELKMMAIFSKDKHMLAAFRENRDIHLETALRAYGDASRRFDGKTLNFTTQYGGGDQEDKDAFFGAYPGVLEWTRAARAEARELGYVRTLFKRKRTLPEIQSLADKIREHGEREAISTVIQGSSAEVIKVAMRRIWEDIKDTDIKMVLQVHDELVFELPESMVMDFIPHAQSKMEYNELSLPITFSFSYGRNWDQMTKWNKENNNVNRR